mmetsp:Transcript_29503/g.48272  ORF Transcript_29503/g.48272 Transcript_29503/m.48272 type:complete len:442 (+) Transcript_29503:47-1372(+)
MQAGTQRSTPRSTPSDLTPTGSPRSKKRVKLGEADTFCISPRKTGVVVTDPVNVLAAIISLMGVGGSAGYYLAAAGFFEHHFNTQTLFLLMLITLYIPYPVTMLCQEAMDSRLDMIFTTRNTYFFRVILVPVMLAGIFVAYAFCSKSVPGILVCGSGIGLLSAACMASTMQLMSAQAPHLTAWASLGRDLGGVFPVVTYWAFDFSASKATTQEFQRMLVFPGFVLCLCALFSTGLHCAGVWDKAYSRLSYDLSADNETGRGWASESDPLLGDDEEVDEQGVPYWIPKWQFANGYNTFLTFVLMPLVCFSNNPHLTQQLTLAKLLMDCLARTAAALVAQTDAFGLLRPRHYCLIAQEILRSALFAILLLHLLGFLAVPRHVFMCMWLLHYFDGSMVASQIDITVARFVPVAARKGTSRRSFLANYLGLGASLSVDVLIMFSK